MDYIGMIRNWLPQVKNTAANLRPANLLASEKGCNALTVRKKDAPGDDGFEPTTSSVGKRPRPVLSLPCTNSFVLALRRWDESLHGRVGKHA